MKKPFRVVGVSDNTNSFGLRGVVLMAISGESWQVAASELTIREHKIVKGADVEVPCFDNGHLAWGQFGVELPRELPKPGSKVLNEVFPDRAQRIAKLVQYGGDNPDAAPKNYPSPEVISAFELGYKCAEKGMNIGEAMNHLMKIYI